MPRNPDIKKVLVIGSGPIVIGQAAEFDYAGTQACRALKEEGLEVMLINSNPATIMTDGVMADEIYIEPLTLDTVKRIIEKEKPDSLLSTLGGQTGLNLSMELAKDGFLAAHNVKLLGANPETIDKAEDRQVFKDTMESIGQPVIPSKVVTDLTGALSFAKEIGYPVIVRPAFTLGGSGGGIAQNEEELRHIAATGLRLSPITQVLIEKCISGWKEIEFEVMRDSKGNVITVCSMENFDPVGVHTGDSIVIAPAVTLSDKEYQMLRSAALNIITAMGIEGGCNCQFALNPDSFEYAVIEVNPRVSRSSALASKATGYPIAKVAALIAIGYTLDEITNAVTGKTCACFEPTLDYVAVKLPKWPFDKFVYAKRLLGTQMKATGEVMAIAQNFESAIHKAVRGAEIGLSSLTLPKLQKLTDEELRAQINVCDDERLFVVYEALKRDFAPQEIHDITKIDLWFLHKLQNIARYENAICGTSLTEEQYREGKRLGFPDKVLESISGSELPCHLSASFKMVDTCGAEFDAETPYFYSCYDEENEAAEFIAEHQSGKETVIVFGSGPIRIGQGIEFDYCCVHASYALAEAGFETIMVNCNPETVSTDYDTSDKLYFEPLTFEDVMDIVDVEQPDGVVVTLGGQTPLKLARALHQAGVPIMGTSPEAIDLAEDRDRFAAVLDELDIVYPAAGMASTFEEACVVADQIGFPLLVRPSYVLGGRGMGIVYDGAQLEKYMAEAAKISPDHPVYLDRFLEGAVEVDLDALCDGEQVYVGGVLEHIEMAGIHSGDSACCTPPFALSEAVQAQLRSIARRLALRLGVVGLINIQFAIKDQVIYIIEANPRASRTVPFTSKATGVPLAKCAARVMAGERIAELGLPEDDRRLEHFSVKEAVMPFGRFPGADTVLGPEMKSTGEVMGIARNFPAAFAKTQLAISYALPEGGTVFISVCDRDKRAIVSIARDIARLGFRIVATGGTARALRAAGVECEQVKKIHEGEDNVRDMIAAGDIALMINTPFGHATRADGYELRLEAVKHGVTHVTNLAGAQAMVAGMEMARSAGLTAVALQDLPQWEPMR